MSSESVIKNCNQKLSSKIVIRHCHQKLSSEIVIRNCHLSDLSLHRNHSQQSHHGINTQSCRHDICQKNYATAVLGARILRKKNVNHDISQFATKERKCFKMALFATKERY